MNTDKLTLLSFLQHGGPVELPVELPVEPDTSVACRTQQGF